MPKVVFVNEHRIVEVPPGKNLKSLALELGINPHREFFRGVNCGYFGMCGTCQVKIQGDVEITTFAGGDGRLRAPRPIAPPPQPTIDSTAKRKPVDASSSAEFIHGHPSAVGTGTRVATKRMATEDEETTEEESAAEGD